jgi:hypothetical protein
LVFFVFQDSRAAANLPVRAVFAYLTANLAIGRVPRNRHAAEETPQPLSHRYDRNVLDGDVEAN